jgi:purine-cytosine permease-like protein
MTPIAIVGAHRFYDTLVNFTGIIGYWASAFGAVVIVEHLYFRRNRFIETMSSGTSPAVPHVDSEANRRESPSTDPDVEANPNLRAVPAPAPAYDLTVWNTPSKLPPGIAALLASVLAFGLVIPSMDQVWFVGPFAQRIGGDIGFEMAFAATAVFYVPLRYFERRFFKR